MTTAAMYSNISSTRIQQGFPFLTKLEKNIYLHTIAGLNEALSGDIIIVEKDIKEPLYVLEFAEISDLK